MELQSSLAQSLTNHKPTEEQISRIEDIRRGADKFAEFIDVHVSPGAQKSIAHERLEESVMWAVKGIILGGLDNEKAECVVKCDDNEGAAEPGNDDPTHVDLLRNAIDSTVVARHEANVHVGKLVSVGVGGQYAIVRTQTMFGAVTSCFRTEDIEIQEP